MSKSTPAGRVRTTYDFIKAQSKTFPVQALCRVLDVALSGYYAWLKQPLSNRAQEDARLHRLIRASFVASQGIYGAPRVFLDLREAGETWTSQSTRSHRIVFGRSVATASCARVRRSRSFLNLGFTFTGVCVGPIVITADGLTLKGVDRRSLTAGGRTPSRSSVSVDSLVDFEVTNVGLTGFHAGWSCSMSGPGRRTSRCRVRAAWHHPREATAGPAARGRGCTEADGGDCDGLDCCPLHRPGLVGTINLAARSS
jgi:hypothetical protein